MEFLGITPDNVLSFLLTFLRISVVLFLLPVYGTKSIPNTVKAATALVLSLAFWPHLGFDAELFPSHRLSVVLMVLGEVTMGLTLGLVVNFIFAAVQTGGQLIGFQMGYAMVSVVDPLTGTSESITAHFLWMVSMLTFLTLNGHLALLAAVGESFKLAPPGSLFITSAVAGRVLEFSGVIFSLAVQIAAPVLVAIFLADLGLALMGRAAPQMNVMMVGFPLKIIVGFFFLGLIFQLMSDYMAQFISELPTMLTTLLLLSR